MTISSLIFDIPPIIVSVFYVLADWASSPLPAWLAKVVNFPLETILSFSTLLKAMGVDISFFVDLTEQVMDMIVNTPVAIFLLLWCTVIGGFFTIIFAVVDILDRINFLT